MNKPHASELEVQWLGSSTFLVAIEGVAEEVIETMQGGALSSGSFGIFGFQDGADAVRFAIEHARGEARASLIVGVGNEALIARAKAASLRAAPGQVVLTLASQDLVRDLVEDVVYVDNGNVDILGRVERLFTVQVGGRRSDLLVQDSPYLSFIGRSNEIEQLRRLIELNRLVTLVGQPGMGKTSLIRRVILEMDDLFADGTLYVDLKPTSSPEAILILLARLLEVVQLPGEEPIDSVIAHLRNKQSLLVFDNAQRMLPALRRIINRVVTECRDVAVLVGSQKALRVTGEQRMQLAGMEVPTPAEHWQVIQEYDSVNLFEDRAKAFDPNFEVNASNASDIAMLCRRLDGNPMAIELSASKTHILSPKQIVRRLQDRFLLLKGPDESTSLRDAIAVTHDLLSPTAKAVLHRLSVFAGAFTVDWASEVCQGSGLEENEIFMAFEELADCALLSPTSHQIGEKLFTLNESIQAFAQEELAASGADRTTRKRHAEWCLQLASAASVGLASADQAEWLTKLDAVYPDIRRTILEQALPRANGELAAQILLACYPYLWERCYASEGLYLTERVAASAGAKKCDQFSRVLNLGASFAGQSGNRQAAERYASRALKEALRVGTPSQIGAAWAGKGLTHHMNQDFGKASEAFRHAYQVFEEIGDLPRQVTALCNVISADTESGNYEGAEEMLALGFELEQQITDPGSKAGIYQNGAHLALAKGDYISALKRTTIAFEINVCLENASTLASCARNAAYSLEGLGHLQFAALWLNISKAIQNISEASFLDRHAKRMVAAEERLAAALGSDRYFRAKSEASTLAIQDLPGLLREHCDQLAR